MGKAIAYQQSKEEMIRTRFTEKKVGHNVVSNKEIFSIITDNIIEIHVLASVPHIPRKKIMEKVNNLWAMKADALKRQSNGDIKSKKVKWGKKKAMLEDVIDTLFKVLDEKNMPTLEQEFVNDQKEKKVEVDWGH